MDYITTITFINFFIKIVVIFEFIILKLLYYFK